MVEALKTWFSSFLSVSTRTYRFWDVQYLPSDIEKADKELKVSERATKNAAKDLPPPSATEPDYVEAFIRSHFTQRLLELHTNASTRLGQYRTLTRANRFDDLIRRIRSMPETYSTQAEQDLVEAAQELTQTRARLEADRAELDRFRQEHRLREPPAERKPLIMIVGIPVALLAVEIAFNAAVFKDASPTGAGVKGGIVMAFILAFFNVALAAVFGLLLRFKNLRGFVNKLIGYGSLLVLALYVPFNLIIAHLRDRVLLLGQQFQESTFDQIVLQRSKILEDAIAHALSSPLGFSTVESVGLLGIGVFFAYVAAWDGYIALGRVPHYPHKAHATEEALEHLLDVRQEVSSSINERYERALKDIDAATAELHRVLDSIKDYFRLRDTLIEVYESQAKDYQECCKSLIQRYRGVNSEERASAQPRYFQSRPGRLQVPALSVDTSLDINGVRYYDDAMAKVGEDIERARKELANAWGEARQKATHLTADHAS